MNRIHAILLLTSLAAAAGAEDFQITITNTGPQPLSPLFYSASTNQFDIFSVSGSASTGIKNVAESGDATALLGIAAGGTGVGTFGLVGASPLVPGASRMLTFSADAAHPFFSFAAMLGKTNDGFIGESVSSAGLQLFSGGVAQSLDISVLGTRAWDAGTEKNTQDAADLGFLGGSGNPQEDAGENIIRVHGGVIPNVGDSWSQMPAWDATTQLAHIQVQAVPEPSSYLALGAGALMLIRRRRKS